MHFAQVFLLVASLMITFLVGLFAFRHQEVPGAKQLSYLMAAAIIWTMGSLFELTSNTFESMLFWRNVQQIGVFTTPIITVYFALAYTGQTKFIRLAHILSVFPALSLALIFSNDLHGWMRSAYSIEVSATYGDILIVQSTLLGQVLVGINFITPWFAMVALISFALKVAPIYRRRVVMVLLSILLVFIMTWLKMAVFTDQGVHVSISVLYTPGVLLMFYSIFRYKLFSLHPVARDKVFEVVDQGIVVFNDYGTVVDANQYAINLLSQYGLLAGSLIGKTAAAIQAEPKLSPLLAPQKVEGTQVQEISGPSGIDSLFVAVRAYSLDNPQGQQFGRVLLLEDVTKEHLHRKELKYMAETDPLTKVNNRRSFFKACEQVLAKPDDYLVCSFFIIDLDHFKVVNDSYGHSVGDRVLEHFAALTKSLLREGDIIGRLGGEEFGVLLPHTGLAGARQVAERLRKEVEQAMVMEEVTKIAYTVSIGITTFEAGARKSLNDLYKEADQALYAAKENGRNSVMHYDETGEH